MKIEMFENKYLVFLNKEKISNIDFKIKKQVETCFRDIFSKIKKRSDKDISGLFNIKVYLNDLFGSILIIEKENIEYYEYFSNQIDMQIEIEYDATVLLEFNDIFDVISKRKIFSFNKKYYIEYIEDINYTEFSNIVYGEKAENIMKKAVVLDNVCNM